VIIPQIVIISFNGSFYYLIRLINGGDASGELLSKDIDMEFRFEKCVIRNLKRGVQVSCDRFSFG